MLAPARTLNVRGPVMMRTKLVVATVQVPEGSSIEYSPAESVLAVRLAPPFVKTSSRPGTGHVPQAVPFGLFGRQSGTGPGRHFWVAGSTGPQEVDMTWPLTVPEPPAGPGKRYTPHAAVATRIPPRSAFLIPGQNAPGLREVTALEIAARSALPSSGAPFA